MYTYTQNQNQWKFLLIEREKQRLTYLTILYKWIAELKFSRVMTQSLFITMNDRK